MSRFGHPLVMVLAAYAALASSVFGQDLRERAGRLLAEGSVEEAAVLLHDEASLQSEPNEQAAAFNNACVLLSRVGQLELALRDCERAVAMRRELDDSVGVGRSLNNQGIVLQGLGQLNSAAASFSEALELNSSIEEIESSVINRLNLGAVYSYRGDHDQALRLYREAEEQASEAGEDWAQHQIFVARQNQGSALERLEAHEQALELYLELVEEVASSTQAAASVSELANLEHNIGVVYRNLGDAVEAEHRLRLAIDLFASSADLAGESSAWLNLALLQRLEYGDATSAVASMERARELAVASGDTHDEVQVLSHLLEAFAEMRAFDRAEEILERTRQLTRTSESVEAEWRVALGEAQLAVGRRDLDAAITSALSAVGLVDDLSRRMDLVGDRARFVEARKSAFALAVDLLLRQAELGQQSSAEARIRAFETMLRSKERVLAETSAAGTSSSLFDYARIQEALDGAVLIEFLQLKDELVRFILDDSGLRHERFPPGVDFERPASRLRRSLADGLAPDPGEVELLSTLVRGVQFEERLFVSATGALNFFPWEVLIVDPDSDTLLFDLTSVAMLPSAASVSRTFETSANDTLRWVTVAAPNRASKQTGTGAGRDMSLRALRFADAEAQMVGAALRGNGVALEEDEATAERLLGLLRAEAAVAGDTHGARIVHVAAHTMIDDRPGGGAAILLAGAPFGAADLESETLDVGLAVLAACSTQNGTAAGRMLSTLTGAWLAAGADAVLATLWDVDDASTYSLMEQFYHQLSLGLDPQVALTVAKRKVRADPAWKGTNAWSAFVLVGDARSVIVADSRFGSVPRQWLPLALLLLALVALYRWHQR